jgi:hypothetical protein
MFGQIIVRVECRGPSAIPMTRWGYFKPLPLHAAHQYPLFAFPQVTSAPCWGGDPVSGSQRRPTAAARYSSSASTIFRVWSSLRSVRVLLHLLTDRRRHRVHSVTSPLRRGAPWQVGGPRHSRKFGAANPGNPPGYPMGFVTEDSRHISRAANRRIGRPVEKSVTRGGRG